MVSLDSYAYAVDEYSKGLISGWVLNRKNFDEHVIVKFLMGSDVFLEISADNYREDLKAAGVGQGDHAFYAKFDPPLTIEELLDINILVEGANDYLKVDQKNKLRKEIDKKSVYLEISDLINFLRHEKRVTGIQRLVSQLCWSLISSSRNLNYKFCALLSESENGFVELNQALLHRLLRAILDDIKGDDLLAFINDLVGSVTPVHAKKGDLVLGTGASFSFVNYPLAVKQLKRTQEIQYGTILYDLIPYYSRSTLPPELSIRFSLWLAQIAEISDFIISISEYTNKELTNFCTENGIFTDDLSRVCIPLGSHAGKKLTRSNVQTRHFFENEFCLFVSTMETRKNHAALLSAWKKLINNNSDVPQLVLVGKKGWGFHELENIINADEKLESKVLFIHDASDSDLEWLYRNCLFTIYPSLYEGWGLPVTESLARGKFCLCSNTTSLPEAGGEYADYFDPSEVKDIYEKVSRYLYDHALIEEKERLIKNEYKLRTWHDYAADMDSFLSDFSSKPYREISLPVLENGFLYQMSRSRKSIETFFDFVRKRSIAYLCFNEGDWFVPEDVGRWLHGAYGSFSFRIKEFSKASKTHVYLKYWLGVNIEYIDFDILINGKSVLSQKLSGAEVQGHKMSKFLAAPTESGEINIEFRRKKIVRNSVNEPRDLFIAIMNIGVAIDTEDRLNIIEELGLL